MRNVAKLHRPYPGERCSCGASFAVRAGEIVCVREKIPKLRRCSACKAKRPLGEYQVIRYADGRPPERVPFCRACRAERAKAYRRGKRIQRGVNSLRFRVWSKPTLLARCEKLVAAAAVARSSGVWRGKDGIRAYRTLGEALEPFKNNPADDPNAIDDTEAPVLIEL